MVEAFLGDKDPLPFDPPPYSLYPMGDLDPLSSALPNATSPTGLI